LRLFSFILFGIPVEQKRTERLVRTEILEGAIWNAEERKNLKLIYNFLASLIAALILHFVLLKSKFLYQGRQSPK
jgi:hypothetical protein